jgi:serine/threonine protein kinase
LTSDDNPTILQMLTAQIPWSEEKFDTPFRALFHIGNSGKIPAFPDTLSEVTKSFVLACLTRDPALRSSAEDLVTT